MPMMSRRLDEDDEAALPTRRSPDREMTLGTGAILGIFFGLVVLLGAFFGFGYKMGSSAAKAAPSAALSDAPAPEGASNPSTFSSFKPSAGSPAAAPTHAAAADSTAPVLTAAGNSSVPSHAASSTAEHEALATTAASQPHSPAATASPAGTGLPAASASGTFYVQVSAVSRQETADLLVRDLQNKGIIAFTRSVPGDSLIHVQTGPYVSKKDAETMKERISSAGYNPILK